MTKKNRSYKQGKSIRSDFDKLKAEWYKKLKEDGFQDIENTFSADFSKWKSQVGLTQQKSVNLSSMLETKIDSHANVFSKLTLDYYKAWSTYATHFEHALTKKEFKIMWLFSEGISARKIAKQLKAEDYPKPRSEWAVFYYLKNKWAEVKQWNIDHIDGTYNTGEGSLIDQYFEAAKENLFQRPEVLMAKRKAKRKPKK